MNLLDKLDWKPTVLLDGALGTELQRGGMPIGKSTITQNIENPSLVTRIHLNYIEAGSQAVTSNTFAGNVSILKSSGIEIDEVELNRRGVEIAREAVKGNQAKVAAGMGPTGEFHVNFDESRITDIYTWQAEMLKDASPDFYLIETMFDLREALAALHGVKKAAGDTPVSITMTFKRTRQGFFSEMGDPAVESLKFLQDAGADAVGANCTLTPDDMLELLREVRKEIQIPLIMQPNAGQPEIDGDEIFYKIEPRVFAEGLIMLAGEGAEIIGGCCGSTPGMMKIVSSLL